MARLEAEKVSKTYGTGKEAVQALDNVSLTVEDGEFVSIVGPSGCGKTTFLRILDGLVEPSEGTILIDGEPVEGSGQDRGMVFQKFNLFPWRSVLENVTFGLEARGEGKEKRRDTAQEFVNLVGLDGFEDTYPHELSGGMQQRVGLARALAIDPEILLMDEPFGALDAQTRELMQNELLKIWTEQQKTSIFVTHDIEEAIFLADKVVVFTDRPGRIQEIVDVPFDRPRYNRNLHQEDAFSELRYRLWDMLMEEQTVAPS